MSVTFLLEKYFNIPRHRKFWRREKGDDEELLCSVVVDVHLATEKRRRWFFFAQNRLASSIEREIFKMAPKKKTGSETFQNFTPYKPKKGEEYMGKPQRDHFLSI